MSRLSDALQISTGKVDYFTFTRFPNYCSGRKVPSVKEMRALIEGEMSRYGKPFAFATQPFKDSEFWLYDLSTVERAYHQVVGNIERSMLGDCDDKSSITSAYWIKLVLKGCPILVVDGMQKRPDNKYLYHEFYAIPTAQTFLWKNTAAGPSGYEKFWDARVL